MTVLAFGQVVYMRYRVLNSKIPAMKAEKRKCISHQYMLMHKLSEISSELAILFIDI